MVIASSVGQHFDDDYIFGQRSLKKWILIRPWLTSLIGSCVRCWKIASGLWPL